MAGLAIVIGGLAAFGAVVFVGHLGWQHVRWRRDCRAAGEKLYREAAELYHGEHEYRVASLSEWPEADLTGHGRVRDSMTASGLRHLGTFENLTVTRVYPTQRTPCDAYADTEGTTVVLTYQIGGRQTVECVSVAESGRLLRTTNGVMDTMAMPPEVDRQVVAGDTAPERVLDVHRQRLSAFRGAEPRAQLVRTQTLTDCLSACKRSSGQLSSHRRAIGLATEQEMVGPFVGTDREKTARRVWREFRRCRARDIAVAGR